MSTNFNNIDLENIYIDLEKEIYIDQLILWLELRKKSGYNKIKPESNEKIITLITIR